MNPRIYQLHAYPFERLAALKEGITPNPAYSAVALSIGEPKHAPPEIVLDVLADRATLEVDLATYPTTRGSIALREAIGAWLKRRFAVQVDVEREVLARVLARRDSQAMSPTWSRGVTQPAREPEPPVGRVTRTLWTSLRSLAR